MRMIDANAGWSRKCPTVYLCGPMSGLTFHEANTWRLHADDTLGDHFIEAINPLRHLDMAAHEVFLAASYEATMKTDRSITVRDRMDVKRSDLLLANLLAANKTSVGSAIEFGWADLLGIPVVTVLDLKTVNGSLNQFNHPMIRDISDWVVPTLGEALDIVVKVLR